MRVVYPGSFDPVTYGHLDVIKRCSKIFKEVIVAVLVNRDKNTMFSLEEREEMLKDLLSEYDNVTVASFSGLTVEYAKEVGASAIIRGIRGVSDYEYEKPIAIANNAVAQGVETLFIMSGERYSYLSSTIVKEFATYGADIKTFVPARVAEKIHSKTKKSQKEQ